MKEEIKQLLDEYAHTDIGIREAILILAEAIDKLNTGDKNK